MKLNGKNNNEILMKVVAKTLSDYALVFGDWETSAGLKAREAAYVMSSVRFTGKLSGTLLVAASAALCREIAASVLGLETENKSLPVNKSDALNEFANIAAGHFITEAAGTDASMEIQPPVFQEIPGHRWKDMAQKAGGGFVIDDEAITAVITIDNVN